MRILGIETSCDETAVCLIEAEGSFNASFKFRILGNALRSQAATHAPYGGVFPNLAKREHAKNLVPLLKQVLQSRKRPGQGFTKPLSRIGDLKTIGKILEREPELFETLEEFLQAHERPEIDAIAVTHGPGLEPALWVGVNFAKALALVWDAPIVAVNHLEGHITIAAMDTKRGLRNPFDAVLQDVGMSGRLQSFEFPALALLISGGHTELDLMPRWLEYKMLGETRDDAVGEAFDKVARMLGLPYPGGPEIARLAGIAREKGFTRPNDRSHSVGRAKPLSLPRPMMNDDSHDFSFSGLKTAVRNLIGGRTLTEVEKMEIAREFEDAAADVLVAKTARAVEEHGARSVLVGGGVSANAHIRLRLAEALAEAGVKLLVPVPELATDNALMIALAGYFHAQNRDFVNPDILRADGSLRLSYKI